MAQTQHTPGPWTPQRSSSLRDGQHDFAVHATKAKVLAKAFGRDSYGNIISAEANARLIAAAPDMLAALHRADRAIVELYRAACPHGNYVHGNNFADNCPEMGVIRAAIAKAEGSNA